MKENLLDVLMDLFNDGMDDGAALDPEFIPGEWLVANSPFRPIQQAFAWLDRLADSPPDLLPISAPACRIYAAQECAKLNVECRGFLLDLEQSGILDMETREQVIDQAMTLETGEISPGHLKLITLMTLFNRLEPEDAVAWMEKLAFDGADRLH